MKRKLGAVVSAAVSAHATATNRKLQQTGLTTLLLEVREDPIAATTGQRGYVIRGRRPVPASTLSRPTRITLSFSASPNRAGDPRVHVALRRAAGRQGVPPFRREPPGAADTGASAFLAMLTISAEVTTARFPAA